MTGMGISNLKAAVMVVRTLRDDDWDRASVQGQIEELDSKYEHEDVMYACVVIARELKYRAPVMLTIKAPEVIARLHEKTSIARTKTGGKRDDYFNCDECGLTQDRCQSQASNLDGADHTFRTIAQAQADRDEQHADGRIAAARARAIDKVTRGPLFQLPTDVTEPTHPEQESA